ncbi:dnaJ homolog subfamily C member 2 [Ochlerotatus camptorhynchus]|uniref:dnaJ homolog subfamily C member 2 n=1 Tax=Ochlerotatus camptorhynchus TaxID=644619 RepID=UPI0031E2AA3A
MATGERILTVALRTNYDIHRQEEAEEKWECLLYLHDTKPIDPECPPTKAELEAAGLLPAQQDRQKTPEEQGKEKPGRLFDKLFKLDVDYLKSLDPKDWKNQDHYAVLGLKDMRFEATEDDIKRAYRKIVLKHHPDKRKGQGQDVKADEDYFHCITMAYETLGTLKNRRAFDSVDPEFDDALPTQSEVKKDFFEALRDVFKKNSRWSESRKAVPQLGDENTERSKVEDFYDFWYNFSSWREFSYLDEEDKDKGQDRDERRWIEKQNKAIRLQRKKEESARIRTLVDLSYNNDPRVVKFKKEDKDRKLAAKRAKQDAYQAQKAEEDRLAKEAALAKQKAAEAEQKRIENIQIEKEKMKRALKKERKILRDAAKAKDYFTSDDKERLKHLEGVEKLCETLKLPELQEFNKELASGGRNVFVKALEELEKKLEEERRAQSSQSHSIPNNAGLKIVDRKALWSHDNVQLLIKAVNLFPAGTISRWEVIANYLNQHGTNLGDMKFYAKDILNKAKELQSGDFSKSDLKTVVNQQAYESFEKARKDLKKVDKADISQKDDEAPAKTNGTQEVKMNGIHEPSEEKENISKPQKPAKKEAQPVKAKERASPAPAPAPAPEVAPVLESAPAAKESKKDKKENKVWSKEEQALLEQAMKTYSVSTPDRWDRIAECIPNRTKKDCLRRVKELVDLVNAKKEAQQSVAGK